MPTYPLTPPGTPGYTQSRFGMKSAVAMTRSPFTFERQVQAHQGQMWALSFTLPPMPRAQAEEWAAWAVSHNGVEGSSLMGDPDGKIKRGSWGTAIVNGTGQTGGTLVVDGMGGTRVASKGDYFQIGTGSSSQLYKLIENATASAGGTGTLVFMPRLRSAPTDNATLILGTAQCRFSFTTNDQAMWDADHVSRYGMSFEMEEDL
jgi:hypothetical protein